MLCLVSCSHVGCCAVRHTKKKSRGTVASSYGLVPPAVVVCALLSLFAVGCPVTSGLRPSGLVVMLLGKTVCGPGTRLLRVALFVVCRSWTVVVTLVCVLVLCGLLGPRVMTCCVAVDRVCSCVAVYGRCSIVL